MALATERPDTYRTAYESPGGGPLATIDVERFQCPEALFRPALMGVDAPGVHAMIHAAVAECDGELVTELYQQVWCWPSADPPTLLYPLPFRTLPQLLLTAELCK